MCLKWEKKVIHIIHTFKKCFNTAFLSRDEEGFAHNLWISGSTFVDNSFSSLCLSGLRGFFVDKKVLDERDFLHYNCTVL